MRFGKILGVAAVLAAVLVLSGCNLGGDHEHSYTKWAITKEPGCVDNGVQSRECEECGYIQTEAIAAVGHTTVKDATVKATCTEDGLTEGSHCSVCGEVLLAQEVIVAHGHAELVDYAVKATCTEEGLTEGKHCAICGLVTVAQQSVEPTGHQYDDVSVVTPANCIQLGTKRYSCIYCNTSYLDTYSTTEHTVVTDAAVPAGCLTDGLTEGSHCEICKMVFTQQEVIPATGHREVVDAAVAPTCTEDGLTEGSHCGNCNEVLIAQEAVAALGHDNEILILQEATCKAEGLAQYTCLVCGNVSQEAYALPEVTDLELYDAAVKYVAEIVSYDKNGNVCASGIGFVIGSDGRIVTAYAMIDGAYSAQVTVAGNTYAVTLVMAYSEEMDLAVVKIDATGLEAAKLCTEELTVGEAVYALSAARGLNNTYIAGTVVAAQVSLDGVLCLEHDISVTAANAGGPLLNRFGEVVAINTCALSGANGVLVAQLDALDYSLSCTLAQLYEQSTSAYEKLIDTILAKGAADENGNVVVYGSNSTGNYLYVYELVYNAETGSIYIKHTSKSASGQQVETLLYLTGQPENLAYAGSFSISDRVYNQVAGTVDAATYTSATELSYDSYDGMKGYESTLMGYYKSNMERSLTWLKSYVQGTVGISMADLGFLVY